MSGDLRGGRPSLPQTLILSGTDVAGLMGPDDWAQAVEAGFRALAEGRADAPPPMAIDGEGGTFHAKGAVLRLDRPYVALKLNGNFPGNPANGLPTIQGAILLCDGGDGRLLAIIDSVEVTLRRTAAATALAARFLARPDSRTVAICGCGAQGRAQLEALRRGFPLHRLLAWDRDPDRARNLTDAARRAGMEAKAIDDLGALRGSDIIVTCTTATKPFLELEMVAPGSFVAAVGADSPDKSEIHPELIAVARLVVDSLEQCAAMGDLRHVLASGLITAEDVHGTLADLVTWRIRGRSDAAQITMFDSTGTALQDVACAALIHERAALQGETRSVRLGAAA